MAFRELTLVDTGLAVVVGVLLAAYATVFLTGLVTEPAFEERGSLRTRVVAG